MVHAAIYIRKSREERDKPSHRLTVQRQQLPEHAQAQGWKPIIYDDGHASAARGKIENLQERARLEQDIRAGKINVILCIEFSRLSRDDSMQDYVGWLHLCSEHQVKLATLSRVLDPVQHSDWMLLLMEGGFSSVEMKVLQQRMAQGRRQAFLEGKYLSGKPPIPYVYDKSIGGLRVDPALLVKAKQIWKLAETHSARGVAEAAEIPLISARRHISDQRLLFLQGLRLDPETGDTIQGQWPAVIDADQAQRIRANRRAGRSSGPRRSAAALFTNLKLVRCGYCGRTVRAWMNSNTRKDGTRLDYYGCNGKGREGKCSKSRMIPQVVIDEKILTSAFITLGQGSNNLKRWWVEKSKQQQNSSADQIAALLKEETELTEQKKRLIGAITSGVLDFTDPDVRSKRSEIDNAISAIQAQQSKITNQRKTPPNFTAVDLTREDFELMTFEEQREFLPLVIDNIRMFANYLLITYRFPRSQAGSEMARIHLPTKAPKPTKHRGVQYRL
jgi:DNA invertase Pin-like site-specific DNA recombinase